MLQCKMFCRVIRFGLVSCVLAVAIGQAAADVTLPAVLGSNMVLQQGKPVRVWGKADAGEKVSVALAGQTASTVAGADGRWLLNIEPPAAGGPYELTISGKNTILLTNILVGEVWVCSGQSNMEWPVRAANDGNVEIAAAKFPKLRLFSVTKATSLEPLNDCKGSWVECSPETVPNFSAVGYFFGRELFNKLDVPVGLIHTAWGGTPAEAWTTRGTVANDDMLKPIEQRAANALTNLPQAERRYQMALSEWHEAAKQAKAEGKPAPPQPRAPMSPKNPGFPGTLYNAMIHPLVPFSIRGAIWYQGEANAGRAFQYRTLLPAMIGDWRKAFDQGDFPFLIVQLANFQQTKAEPGESTWAELREAQTLTAANVPNCGQALAIDIGAADDIHPRNKQEVGRRLALAALAKTYQQQLEYSGPWYAGNDREGSTIRLRFQHIGGGLTAKGGEKLTGFAIAGADKKFYWADARIDGDTVIVSCEKVAEPVAVRYAWADNPRCNLYNRAGLPAVPFRTDDWEGVTFKAR